MTAIAEELDRRLRTLDPKEAARCEQRVRELLAQLGENAPVSGPLGDYVLPVHSFGLRKDIDPTKLGQLADEL